ncbi:MAG: UPF0175 family protein [Anaerolineae bacterium]
MLKVEDLVEAKLYENKETAIQEALRALLREKPHLRLEMAVHRYKTGEISLGKAANLAGISMEQMKEILLNRGIELRLGSETIEEAREEVDALRRHLSVSDN